MESPGDGEMGAERLWATGVAPSDYTESYKVNSSVIKCHLIIYCGTILLEIHIYMRFSCVKCKE